MYLGKSQKYWRVWGEVGGAVQLQPSAQNLTLVRLCDRNLEVRVLFVFILFQVYEDCNTLPVSQHLI